MLVPAARACRYGYVRWCQLTTELRAWGQTHNPPQDRKGSSLLPCPGPWALVGHPPLGAWLHACFRSESMPLVDGDHNAVCDGLMYMMKTK